LFGSAGMMIDDFAFARALHVLALVHWIGGVAMVTTIVLPRARALPDAHAALTAFEAFEGRFRHAGALLDSARGAIRLLHAEQNTGQGATARSDVLVAWVDGRRLGGVRADGVRA